MLLLGLQQVLAQKCPVTSASPIPTTSASWNWEEPISYQATPNVVRQEYCDTWNAYVSSGSNQASKINMGAPWVTANGALLGIGLTQDYQKANGWELLKMNFGGSTGAIAAPYFVLYHKPTGTIRVFAYINSTTSITGVVFTLGHSTNNAASSDANTASLSTSRTPTILAPDKYLAASASSITSEEVVTYVSFYSGPQTWAMGQFTVMPDPNIDNQRYGLNTLQFGVQILVKSEVKLNGLFQFTTDYAMSGSASKSTNGGATVIADGQKYLGTFTSISGKLTTLSEKASQFASDLGPSTSGVVKGIQNSATAVKALVDSKALKTLNNFASTLGGVFGLAGSIIGLLVDSDNSGKTSFVPTTSKGTIELTGSITVQSPVVTFSLFTPGTNHYKGSAGNNSLPTSNYSNLTLYNCPLGVFNIQTTPILEKVDYTRSTAITYPGNQYPVPNNPNYTAFFSFASYRLKENIKPFINAASGMQIKSVKYAICRVVSIDELRVPYTDTRGNTNYNPSTGMWEPVNTRYYNFLYSQVMSGALQAYPYEPQSTDGTTTKSATVIVQTPFTDAHCPQSNSLPFNTPTFNSNQVPVFLRVIAELTPVNASANTASTFFSQDYTVDIVDDPNSSSLSNRFFAPGSPSPYALSYNTGLRVNDPTEPNTYISAGTYLNYSYSGTRGEVANENLQFLSNTRIIIPTSDNGNTPNPSAPITFRANSQVIIEGTLEAGQGAEFAITTDLAQVSTSAALATATCSPTSNPFGILNQQCVPDTRANRTALAVTSVTAVAPQHLLVFPNPTSGSTTAQLTVPLDERIEQLALYNTAGQLSWSEQYNGLQTLRTEIPLAKFAKGIYVLIAKSNKTTYTTKLVIE